MPWSLVRCGAFALVVAAAPPVARSQATQASATTSPVPAATAPAAATIFADSESAPQPPRPPQCRFEDLFRVELRDRRLVIAVLPPKAIEEEFNRGRSSVVSITDSDQGEWLLAGERDGRDGDDDGGYLRFKLGPPPDHWPDRWSPLQLASVSSDEKLYITGSGRVGRTFVAVHFWQEQPMSAVRLTVQRSRRGGVGRPLHDFAAADLLELWNEHQREVRLYLVPLLKTMCSRENLLRPRAGDVYRAFDDIPADAEVTRRVAAILPELEAQSPAAREAASAKLEALGPAGVLAVLRMDRSEWTPEQTARLATFVKRHSTLADPPAWRRDIYFLTDCLDDADPAVRQSALDAVRALAGRDVEFDLDASSQARLAAAAEILRTLESATGR